LIVSSPAIIAVHKVAPSVRKVGCGFVPDSRTAFFLGLLLVAGLGGSGCSDHPRNHAATEHYLTVDIETSPISLDPRFATDAISSRIDELLFDALVRIDEHGNFVGNLAAAIERPSATELLFHIRPGVHFGDGRDLDAADVKFTYDSVIDPASGSPKRAVLEPMERIDALDRHTIRIVTRRPYAAALELATLPILPRGSAVRSAGVAIPAGSGPFKVSAFVRDEHLILTRNRYWTGVTGVAGILFKVVPDPTVRVLELAKGSADFAENNLQPDLLTYLSRRPHLKVAQSPGTSYQYLSFNFRDQRLQDVRVRRAIALAIDRRAIIRALLHDTARIASGMLSPENWAFYGDVDHYDFDPDAADRLLDEAGYKRSTHPTSPRFTLIYKTTPDEERRRLAQALQAMLGRVGIKLEIRTNEWSTFYADIQRGNFDLTSMAWIGINDPHQYYMVFDSRMVPPYGLDRGFYHNRRMDQLLEAADETIDLQQRRRLYAEVQKLAATDLPYISLWWLDNVAVMSRRISGFQPFPNGSFQSFSQLSFQSGGDEQAE
jgi:peptide/nickel transport system substrate-binding protein